MTTGGPFDAMWPGFLTQEGQEMTAKKKVELPSDWMLEMAEDEAAEAEAACASAWGVLVTEHEIILSVGEEAVALTTDEAFQIARLLEASTLGRDN
jgi:hypothetical protein